MAEMIKGFGYKPSNVTANTAATTLITGRGFFGSVVVNKAGSSDFIITLYDNTAASGTVIATITNGGLGSVFRYDCQVTIGLTVKTTSTTHGDITITYGTG